MITIFTIPKPFSGKFKHIQLNAIRSWKKITDDIILYGNDSGVGRKAKELKVRHNSSVVCNEYGTPIMSHVFEDIRKKARFPVVAYVNADVILLDDFKKSINQISLDRFLLIAKRHNVLVNKEITFEKNWENKLRKKLKDQKREKPIGNSSEFFVFPKSFEFTMLDFAVGRLYWDSWLIYNARVMNVPVIDATDSIFYFHQIHDYSHHPEGFKGVWLGEESQLNYYLAGGRKSRFKVTDATIILNNQKLQKPLLTPRRFIRELRIIGIVYPGLNLVVYPIYIILESIFKIGMILLVFLRRGPIMIADTVKHPELLEYKLKEL